MKRITMTIALYYLLGMAATAQNEVTNIRVQQLDTVLLITYDLATKADIEVFVSYDNGETYNGPLKLISGAAGKGVTPDRDKTIVWNIFREVGVDYSKANAVVKLVANPVEIRLLPDMLVAQGKKVYQSGTKLKKDEVRNLMKGSDALRQYNKGIRQNRSGNCWFITGLCMAAGGGVIAAIQPFRDEYTGSHDNNLYYKYDEEKNIVIGSVLMATGGVMMLTGAGLKGSSKRHVRQSVNFHNYKRHNAGVDWHLDFTGNGARLVFNF